MKRLLFIFILVFLLILSFGKCDAQDCPVMPIGKTCIDTTTAEKASALVDKYKNAQDQIAALNDLVKKSDLDIAIKDSLIAKFTKLSDMDTQIEAKQQSMLALLRDEIQDYMDEVAHLKKQLGQGKGKMEKLLSILKVFYYVAASAAVVIGL